MTPAFYSPLIERDLDGAREAISAFRAEHDNHQLFLAVTRFALLAYAPSQHAKHALLACLAAYDLGEDGDILTECALYAASSRQPWSEPPILDPPPPSGRGELAEVYEAIGGRDRLRAERWLSARYQDQDFAHDFFTVAADDFEDLGHKLIMAAAAWRLADLLGEKGRFATLRVAVWEWTAYRGTRHYRETGVALDRHSLAMRLVDNFVCERGALVPAHALFLLDAANAAEPFAPEVAMRVRDYLTNYTNEMPCNDEVGSTSASLVYNLARDYGQLLKIHALATRFPNGDRLKAAAAYNLAHAPSFEEMSFA
ncbi:MAG TPA: hypothetical protein VGR02_22370 [Thermoanaerobaculia bacterium]|jgi:hypothetical protein|nr:hypothetical protein [Thermoanaerobaculia bacterium]